MRLWQKCCENNSGSGSDILTENRSFLEVERLVADILDAPPEQPSAIVAEMRQFGEHGDLIDAPSVYVDRWADELEAAQQRIAELEALIVGVHGSVGGGDGD